MASNKQPVQSTTPLIQPYDPNFVDWNQLIAEADEIQGYRLLKDDDFDTLVGVPFVITKMVFRQGEAVGNGHEGFYVSHEVVIAPEDVLSKYVKDLNKLSVSPGEHIVFNDGSTGIYRQDVKYLAGRGYIELPTPVILNGKSGESTLDLPPDKWTGINTELGQLTVSASGQVQYKADVRISCPRGIRLSDYNAEGFGEAKTRYLG